MKKSILTIALSGIASLFAYNLSAQIEVHNGGKVSIGGNPLNRPSTQLFVMGGNYDGWDGVVYAWQTNNSPYWNCISAEVTSSLGVGYCIKMPYNAGCYFVMGNGDVYANGYFPPSDSSLKKNINPIINPWPQLRKINA